MATATRRTDPDTDTTAGDTRSFPEGFLWGAATAAYQIEGAAAEDGRRRPSGTPSATRPARSLGGDTGDIAVDHYHRFRERRRADGRAGPDGVPLLGLLVAGPADRPRARRPARAWTSTAAGRRAAGARASSRSSRSTTGTCPQELEDAGGWPERDTAERFAEYAGDRRRGARRPGRARGPRSTSRGAAPSSATAPGCTPRAAPSRRPSLRAAHHLNLAHGLGAQALRAALPARDPGRDHASTCTVVRPLTARTRPTWTRPRRIDALANRVFLGPMLHGAYPEDLLADTARRHRLVVRPGRRPAPSSSSRSTRSASTTTRPRWCRRPDAAPAAPRADGHGASDHSPWPGADDVAFHQHAGRAHRDGLDDRPDGPARPAACATPREAPGLPLWSPRTARPTTTSRDADGRVHDPERIAYLHGHLAAVHRAIADGADVRGYFLWSLMDNFEWAYGYSKRFGAVYVDYPTAPHPQVQRPLVRRGRPHRQPPGGRRHRVLTTGGREQAPSRSVPPQVRAQGRETLSCVRHGW